MNNNSGGNVGRPGNGDPPGGHPPKGWRRPGKHIVTNPAIRRDGDPGVSYILFPKT